MVDDRNLDALADAERTCFDRIVEALGLRPGVDAAIGLQPGLADCAVWDIGYLYTGDQAGFAADTFHFRGRLELYSRTRQQVQRWITALLFAFPAGSVQARPGEPPPGGNVLVLRIAPENGAIGEISTIAVKQTEKDAGRETFYCAANFDVVFTIRAKE